MAKAIKRKKHRPGTTEKTVSKGAPSRQRGAKPAKKRKPADYGTTPAKLSKIESGFTRAKRPAGFFKFLKFGDTLQGVYLGRKVSEKKHFSDSLIIETSDGKVLTPASEGLTNYISDNKVNVGDLIKITLIDVIPISGNRTFKQFDFQYKRHLSGTRKSAPSRRGEK